MMVDQIMRSDAETFLCPSNPAQSTQSNRLLLLPMQMLCEVKISDMARVAAFLKRIATVSLLCCGPEAMVRMGFGLQCSGFRVCGLD